MSSPLPLEERLARVERALATISGEVASIRSELAGRSPVAAAVPLNDTTALASERASAQNARDGGNTDGSASHSTDAAASGSGRHADPDADGVRGSRAMPHSAGTARRRLGSDISIQDVELLLGRYAMLAIAVLGVAAAVGTSLSWAIARGYLHVDPPVRVALGLLFAAAICAWGVRMRRTERSFGSSLIGLSLVVVHVCAYSAGPGLQIVPTLVAFTVAALASVALTIVAYRENDEPLWCVGLGGASLAPFVTNDGHGSVYALLGYGVLVTVPACLAVSHRSWPVAWRVFYASTALFTLAGAFSAGERGEAGLLVALAFPFVLAACGAIPFAPEARKRGALRWLLALALLVPLAPDPGRHTSSLTMVLALLAAAAVSLLFVDRNALLPQSSMFAAGRTSPELMDWFDAAIVPGMFVAHAFGAAHSQTNSSVVAAVGALMFAVFSSRRPVGTLRDAAAVAAATVAAGLVATLPLSQPIGATAGYLIVALGALGMHRARPSRGWLVMGLGILVITAVVVSSSLLARPPYQFTPFVTRPSTAAVMVVAAFVVVAYAWSTISAATVASISGRPRRRYASSLALLLRAFVTAPWVWIFSWVLMELSMAYSPSASTLLLVIYFAATAVVCVAVGRSRRAPRLRHVGLALALAAAATAIFGASTYFDPGSRIAAYLVTSAFLLGIAYWYRRPGSGRLQSEFL